MTVPGFTAEYSVYPPRRSYRARPGSPGGPATVRPADAYCYQQCMDDCMASGDAWYIECDLMCGFDCY